MIRFSPDMLYLSRLTNIVMAKAKTAIFQKSPRLRSPGSPSGFTIWTSMASISNNAIIFVTLRHALFLSFAISVS